MKERRKEKRMAKSLFIFLEEVIEVDDLDYLSLRGHLFYLKMPRRYLRRRSNRQSGSPARFWFVVNKRPGWFS